MLCLLLQVINTSYHFMRSLLAPAGGRYFALQGPQLSVQAQHPRSHNPIVQLRQKSQNLVEYAEDRNEQDVSLPDSVAIQNGK